MANNRLSKRPVLSWIRGPRVAGGQEMTHGRSLQRHLSHFDPPAGSTEWAHLAQDRAGWHRPVTTPPFGTSKPFVRQSQGDARYTPEDMRWAVAHRAANAPGQRAAHDATNSNCGATVLHRQPCTRMPRHTDANSGVDSGRACEWNETPPQNQSPSKGTMNCLHTGVTRCLAQPPRGSTTTKKATPATTTAP